MDRFLSRPTPCSDDIQFDEAKIENSMNLRGLKPPVPRCRLDTASTMVPCSTDMSFDASPFASPRPQSEFMLPPAPGMAVDEEGSHLRSSGVSPPLHKVSRWSGINEIAVDASKGRKVVQQLEQATPSPQQDSAMMSPRPKLAAIAFPQRKPPTPKVRPPAQAAAPDSPRTPRTTTANRSYTPPPLVPSSRITPPPMMRALQKQSLQEVQAVLHQNPKAASEPFFDHAFEPPLCYAVRLRCDSATVRLLLQYGADPTDEDVHYRTPSKILQQQASENQPPANYNIELAAIMLGGSFPAYPQAMGWQPTHVPGSTHQHACESWRREVAVLLG